MTRTWDTALDGLPLEERLKALMAFELAADRAAGQPLDVARATVRAAAAAEGISTDHPWIDAAAAQISAGEWHSL